MGSDELQTLLMFVRDGIFSGVFLWLLIREQMSHRDTREAYRQDLRDIAIGKAMTKRADSEKE